MRDGSRRKFFNRRVCFERTFSCAAGVEGALHPDYLENMKTFLALISLLVAAVVLAGCKGSRKGYESAPYRVLESDGKFELRDYPALAVVETPMRGDSGSSFQRLFRYISGLNTGDQKIAMTTPVFMDGGE